MCSVFLEMAGFLRNVIFQPLTWPLHASQTVGRSTIPADSVGMLSLNERSQLVSEDGFVPRRRGRISNDAEPTTPIKHWHRERAWIAEV